MPKKIKKPLLKPVEEYIVSSTPDNTNKEVDADSLADDETVKRQAIAVSSLSPASVAEGGNEGGDAAVEELLAEYPVEAMRAEPADDASGQISRMASVAGSEEDVVVDVSQVRPVEPEVGAENSVVKQKIELSLLQPTEQETSGEDGVVEKNREQPLSQPTKMSGELQSISPDIAHSPFQPDDTVQSMEQHALQPEQRLEASNPEVPDLSWHSADLSAPAAPLIYQRGATINRAPLGLEHSSILPNGALEQRLENVSERLPTQADEAMGTSSPSESETQYGSGDLSGSVAAVEVKPDTDEHSSPSPTLQPKEPEIKPGAVNPVVSRRPKKKYARIAWIMLAILLVGLLAPTVALVIEGIHLYPLYTEAHDGMQHLLNVKTIFTGPGNNGNGPGNSGKGVGNSGSSQTSHLAGLLDEGRLHQAQQELTLAHQDFLHLSRALRQDPAFDIGMKYLPQQITSSRALSKIGLDTTEIGLQLIQTALQLAPSFRGPLLADTQKPLVTPAMIALVRSTIDYLLPRLSDIQLQARSLSLASLPINVAQRQQLTQLLQLVPQVQTDLTQGRALLSTFSWMLGVDSPRTFLIQTMDRAELRPTGGFTGQFGELVLKGGRLSPFSLKNIGPFEENNPNSPFNGQLAPAPYTWWPIPNWGLRDSNLSADFPTSARFAMQLYKREFGHQVDGVILFSPFLISHILQVTGPITLPEYQETITAQNLEARLHYYQLDNVGIRKEEIVEHVPDSPDAPTQARKLFTAKLARMLMDQVRHAPPDELLQLASHLLSDMKTRDLQVYVTNQDVENLLIQFGGAGQMDRSTTHDGFYVVQANVSASKASQYVTTRMHDTVTLNPSGGASHVLQVRLAYNQIGPVYGLDTYRDYIRIYVPLAAQFRWGNGFDSGTPLCGGPFRACPLYDVYNDGDLLCPAGMTQAGYSTSLLNDPYSGGPHPIDKEGPPTNMSSDEPGRAMFAGWVILPKNCTITLSLSWYVPSPAHASGYTLLVQRQSSTFPDLDITIIAPPGKCNAYSIPGIHFSGIMGGQDMSFSLPAHHNRAGNVGCIPPSTV